MQDSEVGDVPANVIDLIGRAFVELRRTGDWPLSAEFEAEYRQRTASGFWTDFAAYERFVHIGNKGDKGARVDPTFVGLLLVQDARMWMAPLPKLMRRAAERYLAARDEGREAVFRLTDFIDLWGPSDAQSAVRVCQKLIRAPKIWSALADVDNPLSTSFTVGLNQGLRI